MRYELRLLLPLVAAILGLTMSLANAQTRTVEATRLIPASPDEVLKAFLDDGDLKAWWKVSRSLVEPKEGGVWSITWDDWGKEKTQHAWFGEIDVLTPGRLLISRLVMMEPGMPLFGPMQLEITVEPAGRGTSLTVTHRGYHHGDHWDEIYELVVNGWDHVLGDLETWTRESY